ncbi:MAG: hypothetical protein UY18_C0005G0015 [Microgenomates group bacterium GW2011_GWF2_47_9]|nr:MAG: hypothetical protein UY18_C0005G0015 [Microgenomates group bacterium GW2011_GWF2_47_9]
MGKSEAGHVIEVDVRAQSSKIVSCLSHMAVQEKIFDVFERVEGLLPCYAGLIRLG